MIYDELGMRFLRVTGQVSGRQVVISVLVIVVHDQRPLFGVLNRYLYLRIAFIGFMLTKTVP